MQYRHDPFFRTDEDQPPPIQTPAQTEEEGDGSPRTADGGSHPTQTDQAARDWYCKTRSYSAVSGNRRTRADASSTYTTVEP